jgi:hypothetical protein
MFAGSCARHFASAIDWTRSKQRCASIIFIEAAACAPSCLKRRVHDSYGHMPFGRLMKVAFSFMMRQGGDTPKRVSRIRLRRFGNLDKSSCAAADRFVYRGSGFALPVRISRV